MSEWREIYWLRPTGMMAWFLAGVGFAIGHHAYYRSLAGTAAPATGYDVLGLSVSGQNVNIAIGSTFALLSRSSLILAVSTAYMQAFWRAATRTRQPMLLGSVNAAFGALDSMTAFLHFPVWWRHPLLLFLAMTAWLLPIASVITPSMLSVEVAPVRPPPVSKTNVPGLDFTSLNYFATGFGYQAETVPHYRAWETLHYQKPATKVQAVAATVVSDGNIVHIPAPWINATWQVSFSGPSLTCRDLDPLHRQMLICRFLQSSYLPGRPPSLSSNYHLVAWTTILNPFSSAASLGPAIQPFNSSEEFVPPMPLYMAALPPKARILQSAHDDAVQKECTRVLDHHNSALSSTLKELLAWKHTTILKCELHNSTYDLNFNYTNGQQRIISNVTPFQHIDRLTSEMTIPVSICNSSSPPSPPECPQDAQWVGLEHFLGRTLTQVRQLSYRSIMDSFRTQLVGSLYTMPDTAHAPLLGDSSIMETALLQTRELQFLNDIGMSEHIQASVASLDATLAHGLLTKPSSDTRRSLAHAIEESFQNLTISLMSSEYLRSSPSSLFAPPPANVTLYPEHAVYVYAESKLWLAYGLEVAFALLAVLVGVSMFLANGASFSSDFSSVFLRSRNATLSTEPNPCDLNGQDPLPAYLSKATIRFQDADHVGKAESSHEFSACTVPGADLDERADGPGTTQTLLTKVEAMSDHGDRLNRA